MSNVGMSVSGRIHWQLVSHGSFAKLRVSAEPRVLGGGVIFASSKMISNSRSLDSQLNQILACVDSERQTSLDIIPH